MFRKEDENPITYKISMIIIAFLKKFKFMYSHKRKIQILKNRGLKIGNNVIISDDAIIDGNFCYLVNIGNNCLISAGVRILTHDTTLFLNNNGYAKLGLVTIKDNCIIGSDSLILPGVTIGPNVIVAAGSVINKDIPENSCVAGVPARYYAKFEDVIKDNKKDIENAWIIDSKNIFFGKSDINTKEEIITRLKNGEKVFSKNVFEMLSEINYFD